MRADDRTLLLDAAARAVRYRTDVANRPARPGPETLAALRKGLCGDLPEQGADPAEVIALLDELGSPATLGSTGGRYFGYVVGSSLPVAVAANWLATAWDQNSALVDMSPTAAHLDELAVTWVRQALHLPDEVVGGLVTGATAANIVGLAAARTHLLGRAGWDVETDGLFGAPPIDVIASECAHDSIDKALMVLGLGRGRVTRIPTDDQGRMSVDALPPLDERTLICTQAGHVHTGAFDPMGEITRRAADVGAWVHVDGAFGLWARAAPTLAHLTAGCERADSWAIDMHKWLNVPYDSGMVLTRHDPAIRKAMAAWSPLLQDQRQPAAYTLEQSRRARGVDLWASLAFLGRGGLATMVEGTCALAAALADGCRQAGLEVANEVVLNQVLVSAGDDQRTEAMLRAVNADGVIACSGARWKGRSYLRLSVSSCETTAADIDTAVQAICRARRTKSAAGR